MIESGNAATLVSAYGNQQRANEDRGNIMSNALKDVGGAIQGARKKMDERTANEHLKVYIKSLGGNPEAVDGGLEATKAEILRLHQQTDEASKEKARTVAMAHDVTMQQMSDTAATGRQTAGFANETSQRQGATAEQTAMQRATQTELGGEVGELTAPMPDGAFTGMLGQLPPGQAPIPITRDANEQDVIDRNAAAPGKYRLDSLTAARKALAPDVKPVDPSLIDSRAAQAERDRAAAENLRNPPAKPTKDDSQPIDQADAEQMGVKWRDGMTWGQAKGIAGHRAPASGEGKLSGQNSARATYLREEIGRLQHQIENAYGDTPEEKAAKTDLESLLKDRRAEYDRIAPPVAASPQMPFKGKDAGGDAAQPPGDPAQVKALQAAGKKWDGVKWVNPDGTPVTGK